MAKTEKRGIFQVLGKYGVPALALLAALCLAGPARAQTGASQQEVVDSLTRTFGGITGIEVISGFKATPGAGATHVVGVNGDAYGVTASTTFRIGSQSKMFTGTVVMEVMQDYGLGLDDTLADVLRKQPGAGAKLPPNLVARAGNMTLKQLLNMGTDLPNNLTQVPKGRDDTLSNLWSGSTAYLSNPNGAPGGYGRVAGFADTDPDEAHTAMAGLALDGQPDPPPGGLYSGIYSNSNALILALMAEGITGSSFDTLLNTWLTANGLGNTELQMAQGDAGSKLSGGIIGTSNGKDIVNLDPTIPWVSGAVISSMGDLMRAVEIFNSDPARMADGNTTVIDMHSMPTYYGLGLLALDFDFISKNIWPESEVRLSPLIATGHGGSIAGCSSFSGWLTTGDGTALNAGLITYANVSNAYSRGGIETSTPSETLFVTVAEHLYRQARANGTYSGTTVGYGSTGGYATSTAPGTIASLSFTKATGQNVPFIAYFDWDFLLPASLAISLDPVFTHYSTVSDYTNPTTRTQSNETVFTVNGAVDLPAWARMEGYSGDLQHANSTYTLLNLNAGAAADNLQGQVAVYGSQSTALSANRAVTLGGASLIEAHGYDSTALKLLATTGTNTVEGKVQGIGSKITAIEVGANSNVSIGERAEVIGYSYGSNRENLAGFAGPTTDSLTNGATGLRLGNTGTATIKGLVDVQSANPATAISVGLALGASATATVDGGWVVSDGYGARFTGAGGGLTLNNFGYVAGSQYAVYIEDTATTAAITLAGGSKLAGLVKVEDPAATNATLTADAASTLVGTDYSRPIIDGVQTVTLNGTTVTWASGDLPGLGTPIEVVRGHNPAASVLDFILDLGDGGLLNYSVAGGQITVSGLKAGAYRSPNAAGAYTPWQTASQGSGYGTAFLGDTDNLTHEPFVTLAGAALDAHRQAAGLARRFLFPGNESIYSPRVYSAERPDAKDGNSAALAAIHDGQMAAGLLAGRAASESPSAGGGPGYGLPRIVFDYFHTRASRDDDGYSGYDHEANGLLAGAVFDPDGGFDLSDGLALAFYMGWSKGEADFNYLSAEADTETMFAGVMGRWRERIDADLGARFTGQVSLSSVDNDLSRRVSGPGGLESRVTGSFKQTVTGAGLEAALDWTPSTFTDTSISPWVAVDYLHLKQGDLNEEAAGSAPTALWADGFTGEAVYTTVGAAVTHSLSDDPDHSLLLRGSAAWEHQFGDQRFVAEGGFVAGGGSFEAKSLEMGRDAAVLGLSVESLNYIQGNQLLGLEAGVETRLMGGGHDLTFNLGLEYRF